MKWHNKKFTIIIKISHTKEPPFTLQIDRLASSILKIVSYTFASKDFAFTVYLNFYVMWNSYKVANLFRYSWKLYTTLELNGLTATR